MDTPTQATPAGWYPDPLMAGTQRYWDGRRWTDQSAPLPPPQPASGTPTRKAILIVVAGILGAALVLFTLYQWSQPSALECSTQRLEVANGDRSAFDVHDSCR